MTPASGLSCAHPSANPSFNFILKTSHHRHFRGSAWHPDKFPAGVILLAGLCLCACKKPEAVAPPPPVVEVMEIATSEVPLSATLIGQLDSPQNVDVRARVEAYVKEAPFIEGTEVKEGDLVFQLDDAPYQERLKAAKGALAEAKATLGKYQADVDRLTPLFEKRAIPQQDLDNAKAAVDVGKAGVQTAEARVSASELDLSYCMVHAPITGLIGAKQVTIGSLVGKGEPTLLATMSTLDPMWFYCNISEDSYLRAKEYSLKMGKEIFSLPLKLVLADGKEQPGEGKFVFIDRAVDIKTGTLRIRAEFPNKNKILRPGMFARVRVDIGKRPNTITVPERAIVELQGKTFVWRVSPDGKASQQAVTTGEQVGPRTIISEGLNAGDRIIVEGVHKVREGIPVTVVPAVKSEPPAKD